MPVLPLLKEEIRLVGPFAIQAFLARSPLRSGDGSAPSSSSWPGRSSRSRSTSARRSPRRATRDAHTDSLTLVNNRAYELGLSMALDAAYEDGAPEPLLVDVDDFKQINDTYGHPLGDQVLVEIARLLRPESDCVGTFRFGGDEFAIVLGCDERRRERTSRRCTAAVERAVLHGAKATVSVGMATYPQHADSVGALENAADSALYWAKLNGKNRFCAYSAPSPRRRRRPSSSGHRAPGAAARRREPHPRRRREGRVHGHALRAGRAARRVDRPPAGTRGRAGRAAQARGSFARPRQDRHPRTGCSRSRASSPARGTAARAPSPARRVPARRDGHPPVTSGSSTTTSTGTARGIRTSSPERRSPSARGSSSPMRTTITTDRSYRDATVTPSRRSRSSARRGHAVRPGCRRRARGSPRGAGSWSPRRGSPRSSFHVASPDVVARAPCRPRRRARACARGECSPAGRDPPARAWLFLARSRSR